MVWTLALASAPVIAVMPEGIEWTLVDLGQRESFILPDTVDRLGEGGALTGSPEGSGLALSVDYEPVETDGEARRQRCTRIKPRGTRSGVLYHRVLPDA